MPEIKGINNYNRRFLLILADKPERMGKNIVQFQRNN